MLEISPVNLFIVNNFFASENIAFYVEIIFHVLLYSMSELKFCKKQDTRAWNVGYLSFIKK